MEEAKENLEVDKSAKSKANPWMFASIILAIAVIVLLALVFFRGSGNVSGDTAGKELVAFLNQKTNGGVTYLSYEDKGSYYDVKVDYKNQTIPVQITKDGKYFIQSLVPLAATTDTTTPSTPTDVPKTTKPVAEAYVFAYCPYGLQFEKALLPVYNLLKSKADIKVVYIGAMHGEFEHVESLRQLCIEKNYGRDKLMSYLGQFDINTAIGNCQGTDTCVNPLIQTIYTLLGIDKAKIDSCMTADAPALYSADEAKASAAGISGSPTFVVNGVSLDNIDRTPEAIKQAICSGFSTKPAECNQNLSTGALSAGFGGSAGASSGSSCG